MDGEGTYKASYLMEEPGAEGDSFFGGVATGRLTKLQ